MTKACVIGWPIKHSRSPVIHGYWLKKYGIDGSYDKRAVAPEEAEAFFRNLEAEGLAGCNVTVPLKEVAFASADHRDASALAVKAANTLWLQDGMVHAANTDTYGFMTHLGLAAPGWEKNGKPVVLLGAGGAARAICHGFLEAGVEEIIILNRTRARAEALASDFQGRGKIRAGDWAERIRCSEFASVIVNTTTLGMNGEGDLGLEFLSSDPDCVVADIVYVPLETKLLSEARRYGLKTVDGLGMLLHQAVPGFERWFGIRPEVTAELRQLVLDDIGA